jgi:Flp pilus assembly protein TadD
MIAYGRRNYREATAAFRQSILADPAYAAGHEYLAWSLYLMQDYAGAVAPFAKATELDAFNAQSWAGLGWALHLSGRSDEARPFLEKAASLDPNLALAARGLAALQNAPP